ncbi:thioredoxin family protein [Mesonia aestuariivivens]|uniref:Thioredoxin family protein n=1 Tax=Mesonia aestuariivivens TaxID=2796128 RepID=A0ABS6VY59_9FLAO|nr:thioredoxin family protein [Mesonia aestuariivivens]MBW2960454.1 thioredoxin family protein [Mesonia aestuariivivens]
METSVQNQFIEESLQQAYSYEQYLKLVEELLAEGKSTSFQKEDGLAEYSKLNLRRMKRWDKTLKISPEAEAQLKAYHEKLIWVVIAESWCGDAAHSLPVINQLAALNPNIEMKVVLRDQNEALMNEFLTNGGKSIPKLVMYKPSTKEVIADWGPRPQIATKMVEAYKAEHGSLDTEFKEQLQVWYNKDKGQAIAKEISNLLI